MILVIAQKILVNETLKDGYVCFAIYVKRSTHGEVTSQNRWSRYVRHFVGITWHNVLSQWVKIYHAIQITLNQSVEENVHMIINLPTKRILVCN